MKKARKDWLMPWRFSREAIEEVERLTGDRNFLFKLVPGLWDVIDEKSYLNLCRPRNAEEVRQLRRIQRATEKLQNLLYSKAASLLPSNHKSLRMLLDLKQELVRAIPRSQTAGRVVLRRIDRYTLKLVKEPDHRTFEKQVPRDVRLFNVAMLVHKALRRGGVAVKTTREGVYEQVLLLVLKELGQERDDVHRIVLEVCQQVALEEAVFGKSSDFLSFGELLFGKSLNHPVGFPSHLQKVQKTG